MVRRTSYIPDRGDIVWIDFNPQRGHEQANERPALVLSPKSYNTKTDLMLTCPITSQTKGYPFEVPIQGKKIQGVVLSDQTRTLDWRVRSVRHIEKVHADTLKEVQGKIIALITL